MHNKKTCHYFVDEAGDGILFNKHKKVVIGTEGCSTYFMLGLLEVRNPILLESELCALRQDLLEDKYLSKVPSMQADNGKTARAFHAKDDCAEVRREVYKLLVRHKLKFFVSVGALKGATYGRFRRGHF